MPSRTTREISPAGFTIVELLVVVTVIAVLLAMLTPALETAIKHAELAVCSSNQHNVALAIKLYLTDHKRRYPVMDIWWDLFGELGPNTYPDHDKVTQKPLNVYLGYRSDHTRVPVANCPSDLGDSWVGNEYLYNFYKTIGVSYGAAYVQSDVEQAGYMAVKPVFGHAGGNEAIKYGGTYVAYVNAVPSVSESSLVRLDNKFILADFPWYNGRATKNPRTRAHRPESDERLLNTLFADGHVELMDWDKEYIDPDYGGLENRKYDPSWKWW